TTTTALTAHLFEQCGLNPTVMVGGVPRGGRPWRLGRGGWTVVEGDEYNTAFFDRGPKFLHYYPHFFVVNNVEFDHGDIYPDLDAIVAAFRAGVARTLELGGTVVANAGDGGARRAAEGVAGAVWYGEEPEVDLRALAFDHRDGHLAARLAWRRRVFDVTVPLVGRHNLDNLMAACTCALLAGAEPAAVAAAAAHFPGVRRRMELLGTAAGVSVVDDFAHHPTAVRETLAAIKEFGLPGWSPGAGRLVAAFEPRSNTSRRNVFQADYARAFAAADLVFLREPPGMEATPEAERLSSARLAADLQAQGQTARAFDDGDTLLAALLAELRPGDLCLVMSNGGFDNLHARLLDGLAARA
ncbi:MAG: UDP-N-acetylmuramate:L-alanyl-gamma-D-glutamyl-meso-diaminopimelate ligase, partial [Desulfarculus sp.]|nr:UDP-N-acetylmuramate:L-alanyl-gamma-D-glutamyl-meso-diaminopimelate ligase [Desulfarculus sp.]